MGSWGIESSANDSCWDHLNARNIHRMSQLEADFTIMKLVEKYNDTMQKRKKRNKKKGYPPETPLDYYDGLERVFVGVVTHILYQKLTVKISVLETALKCCDFMLLKKNGESYGGYLTYREPQDRKKCIQSETKDIKLAIKNNGVGQEKYVKGLVEKILKG